MVKSKIKHALLQDNSMFWVKFVYLDFYYIRLKKLLLQGKRDEAEQNKTKTHKIIEMNTFLENVYKISLTQKVSWMSFDPQKRSTVYKAFNSPSKFKTF